MDPKKQFCPNMAYLANSKVGKNESIGQPTSSVFLYLVSLFCQASDVKQVFLKDHNLVL